MTNRYPHEGEKEFIAAVADKMGEFKEFRENARKLYLQLSDDMSIADVKKLMVELKLVNIIPHPGVVRNEHE